ncbi:hypothetical protein P43SY_008853 [Pythium insidiosum]|uniref:Uncharacterized protein n=1 Tax=Pythium insidiosum TaxID=114742 RepID=A0AAD5QDI0_PYTIN|nr:hypothetical protein P43SY_008853 [Pythium insidiosum]
MEPSAVHGHDEGEGGPAPASPTASTSASVAQTSALLLRQASALGNLLDDGDTECKKAPSPSKVKAVDLSGSLAAISARLTPYITPAELEIARLQRDVARRGPRATTTQAEDDTSAQSPDGGETAVAVEAVGSSASAVASSPPHASALHDSMIAEEWVNVHLETSGAFLVPAADLQALLQRPEIRLGDESDDDDEEEDDDEGGAVGTSPTERRYRRHRRRRRHGPLARAGIDRWTLYRLGMPRDLVDRLYRALYVYTNGFHNLINEIAARCPPTVEKHVSANVWLTFLLLLEQCENGKYEMAMLKFKQATQAWREQMQEEFLQQQLRLTAQVQHLETQLHDEATRSHEKSELIAKLAADSSAATATIAELSRDLADRHEQIRRLKLDILVHEDAEKQLNAQLDESRKDFEVTNSERFNALTERFALEEEIRKLQSELERVEAEKTNAARRVHETQFMNQALRATSETLKQNAVVQALEKEKLEKEKQAALDHVERLQGELTAVNVSKADVERELVDCQRRHTHLEERLRAMKEQLDVELEANSRHVHKLAELTAYIDEERVKNGVLEARCNLLTAEKANTGMRAQDKLRIERLLNQKLELESSVEALKVERAKDQETIWNLRASLEALDSELQHTKRVFSAGQQAFLHSERSAEQLRHQLQEVEKSYEKASKNLSSLRERFKMFEESSKEQVTKLEVELKVATAQVRELSYVNRDHTAMIADLHKTLDVAEKESKALQSRLEAAAHKYDALAQEKEALHADQARRDQQHSTSKKSLLAFLRDLQQMLAHVKRDEFPLDEALRELLRMIKDTFGRELDISRVLDDEDEPEEFVEEYNEDELDAEDRARLERRLAARRQGFSLMAAAGAGGDPTQELARRTAASTSGAEGPRRRRREGDTEGDEGDDSYDVDADVEDGLMIVEDEDGRRRLVRKSRMSKFRRTKLDAQVRKMQRELELKTELVQSLEGVICSQADEMTALSTANDQHVRWLKLKEQQKGMLRADLEAQHGVIAELRAQIKRLHVTLEDVKIELVVETNRAFQIDVQLQGLRRQYDMQCASTEDLLSRIGRAYEHELWMRSLRRDEAVQATVVLAHQFTQTLVPQRNPALERLRMPEMVLPARDPTTSSAEAVIKQINNTAKLLLPGVTQTADIQLTLQPAPRAPGLVQAPPIGAVAKTKRTRRQQSQSQSQTRRPRSPVRPTPRPQMVRHVNEFGTRQDVLISPVLPPFFPAESSAEPVPGELQAAVHRLMPTSPFEEDTTPTRRLSTKLPRKPDAPRQLLRIPTGHNVPHRTAQDERSDSPRATGRRHGPSPRTLKPSPLDASHLQYHRGFLRTGLEVLRRGVASTEEEDDDAEEDPERGRSNASDEEEDQDDEIEDDDREDGGGRAAKRRPLGSWSSGMSLHSPSQLELAVRDYQKDRPPDRHPQTSPSRYYAHRLKEDASRDASDVDDDSDASNSYGDDDDDGDDDGGEKRRRRLQQDAKFVPGVLYPLMPPR